MQVITIRIWGQNMTMTTYEWQNLKDELNHESESFKRIQAVLAQYQ